MSIHTIYNYPFVLTILLFFSGYGFSQSLTIRETQAPIKIDGVLDEEAWEQAELADHFHQYFPFDTSESIVRTEIKITYDKEFIYVGATMYNNGPREYVVPSLRRDFRGAAFDGISVVLDTYKDRTNGFLFGVNPYGVQREGLISNGGTRGQNDSFTLTWDNKWYAEAKILEDRWVAELAIPFKSIRYKENGESWYMNFYRVDSETGERSSWSPIPRNFRLVNLAFNKEVRWDKPLGSTGKNISLIPYMAYKAAKNFEENTPRTSDFAVGGDAKVAITSALNLDLTFNPDFSQVETDQQVTNLDRFEIFFPEQRQFFLENADLFASFGSGGARPFFSRRIGVARDSSTGANVQNPLYVGGRLSGNLNNKWRIGAMSVQAASDREISLPSINFGVVSVQRRIGKRSNVSAILVGKQAFQDSIGGEITLRPDATNLTAGVDLNLATPDNKWSGKAYFHHSFEREQPDSAFSYGLSASYQTYRWAIRNEFRSIGVNFNPEVGFVRRTDFSQMRGNAVYFFYPSKGPIQSHGPGFDYDVLSNRFFGPTDWDINLLYNINFKSSARFGMRLRRQYTYLFSSFDPSGTGGVEIPEGNEFAYNLIFARFNSDQRKSFFYELSTRSGEYFGGTRLNLEGTLSYRFIPRVITSLNFQLNRIRLPKPYNDADLYLIGPRLDITFSRKIFWTTFVQFNSQINNVNVNTRFQWRYNPVSDLFIVYSDNYFSEIGNRFVDFNLPKSRAIVVKLTYWFNP
ncbi:MAG: DUF5916 domain-containing protein [Bacteroidota bacterium]